MVNVRDYYLGVIHELKLKDDIIYDLIGEVPSQFNSNGDVKYVLSYYEETREVLVKNKKTRKVVVLSDYTSVWYTAMFYECEYDENDTPIEEILLLNLMISIIEKLQEASKGDLEILRKFRKVIYSGLVSVGLGVYFVGRQPVRSIANSLALGIIIAISLVDIGRLLVKKERDIQIYKNKQIQVGLGMLSYLRRLEVENHESKILERLNKEVHKFIQNNLSGGNK